jgi:hypothetical protein
MQGRAVLNCPELWPSSWYNWKHILNTTAISLSIQENVSAPDKRASVSTTELSYSFHPGWPLKRLLPSRLQGFWSFLFLEQKMGTLSWVPEITFQGFMYFNIKAICLSQVVVTGSAQTMYNILILVSEWQMSLSSTCSTCATGGEQGDDTYRAPSYAKQGVYVGDLNKV